MIKEITKEESNRATEVIRLVSQAVQGTKHHHLLALEDEQLKMDINNLIHFGVYDVELEVKLEIERAEKCLQLSEKEVNALSLEEKLEYLFVITLSKANNMPSRLKRHVKID